jgi:hypothetical protein
MPTTGGWISKKLGLIISHKPIAIINQYLKFDIFF